ncbi:MAG: type II toxin-antitoxin system RelE/ParE family toxin [Chitinophagaceae bacterium]
MQIQFRNGYLEKICAGLPVSGKPRYTQDVLEKFRKRILILKSAESTAELQQFRSLHVEALKGDKKGLFSIRIDLKYRLGFSIEKNRITLTEIRLVEDRSNHYR